MSLEVKGLTVSYEDRVVLDNIELSLENGQIIGLVAPNGTGKTSLFNAIMRFIPIRAGHILIDDKEYKDTAKDVLELHKKITFFPDQADLHENFSGKEHIQMYADIWKKDKSKVDAIIDRLQMRGYVGRKVETYSLGMRQRLCFAMVIAADTPIMLMDEVMNGLDPENVNLVSKILQELKREGKIIFVSSHLLDNLDEYADRILFLKDGGVHFVYDRYEAAEVYYKVLLDTGQQEKLFEKWELPDGTIRLNQSKLCIPLTNYTNQQELELFQFLRGMNIEELEVGSLGTSEYYTHLYGNSESKPGRQLNEVKS
ncbi:ATP-binding cassette domain-containing protein [Desemzia sp. RIT804]|uniref:ABC transporter ATP-binding protein n=1 Tax=Desemzia sp. RIT 804 TaxID=2810209 RepID=UPI00194F49B6|nr:ATP-binding cassette domain-containing protein [Desemzia sp. RIT 804]MBM6615971.1 ATP-binding cassette domain-containing protein [Desemzia sp. RIT 804]